MEMQRNTHWDWEAEHICCNLRPLSIFRGCPLNAIARQIFLKLFANSETIYIFQPGRLVISDIHSCQKACCSLATKVFIAAWLSCVLLLLHRIYTSMDFWLILALPVDFAMQRDCKSKRVLLISIDKKDILIKDGGKETDKTPGRGFLYSYKCLSHFHIL